MWTSVEARWNVSCLVNSKTQQSSMRFNQRSNLPWFHWWRVKHALKRHSHISNVYRFIDCHCGPWNTRARMAHKSDREMQTKNYDTAYKKCTKLNFLDVEFTWLEGTILFHSTFYIVIETTWKILISSFPPFLRELIWNFSPIDGALRSLPTSSSFVFLTTLCCHHYNCSFTENWIDFSSSIEQLSPLSLCSSLPHSCAFQHTREWKVQKWNG